MDNI